MLGCTGHTPYRQWQVYRQRHLLIGTSREDAPSYPLGKRVVELLARELPAARARVTRAPTLARLASLISTDQIRVLLLSGPHARAMAQGDGPFADFGPQPLRTLHRLGDHLLVCRAEFPAHHAWLIAKVLLEHGDELAAPGSPAGDDGAAILPLHAGARAAVEGDRQPPAPPPEAPPTDPAHSH